MYLIFNIWGLNMDNDILIQMLNEERKQTKYIKSIRNYLAIVFWLFVAGILGRIIFVALCLFGFIDILSIFG
jgi:membrane protein required for beta-lactamase induction